MGNSDPPPSYDDDIEAAHSSGGSYQGNAPASPYSSTSPYAVPSPYEAQFGSSSSGNSIRSHMPPIPGTGTSVRADTNYIPMTSMSSSKSTTNQKASDRMLALAQSGATEPERIAAMQAVPQLLAEEEKSRQAMQKEKEEERKRKDAKTRESRQQTREICGAIRPYILGTIVVLLTAGLLGGGVFFLMWFVTTPQSETLGPWLAMVVLAGCALGFAKLVKACGICDC